MHIYYVLFVIDAKSSKYYSIVSKQRNSNNRFSFFFFLLSNRMTYPIWKLDLNSLLLSWQNDLKFNVDDELSDTRGIQYPKKRKRFNRSIVFYQSFGFHIGIKRSTYKEKKFDFLSLLIIENNLNKRKKPRW